MPKIQIGDRVAVYNGSHSYPQRWTCKVIEINDKGMLRVEYEGDGAKFYAHPNQCRKIITGVKPREWVITNNGPFGPSLQGTQPGEKVRVREVIERKK